jgi:hypothetical protein
MTDRSDPNRSPARRVRRFPMALLPATATLTATMTAAAIALLAACSSSGHTASPATTATPTPISIAPTTVTTATTPLTSPVTAASTNSPTTTSASEPTAPTTTAATAPPTTATVTVTSLEPLPPPPPDKATIQAAMAFYETRYLACVSVPKSCRPEDFLARQGSARETLTKSMATRAAAGQFAGPGDEPGSLTVTTFVVEPSALAASVDTCMWDTGIFYGPGGATQSTVVVDATKVTRYLRYRVFLEQGIWLVGDVVPYQGSIDGLNKCVA